MPADSIIRDSMCQLANVRHMRPMLARILCRCRRKYGRALARCVRYTARSRFAADLVKQLAR